MADWVPTHPIMQVLSFAPETVIVRIFQYLEPSMLDDYPDGGLEWLDILCECYFDEYMMRHSTVAMST